MAIGMAGALMTLAQTPMPMSSDVRHGTLPNGLNYYILHNEEPKERANFYIAQKVGSTLENTDQLGLAHFLEHMAFNGTKNYPGKNMLNYLQSKGIRFGADINAYTGFDETVYNINNVPTTDQALMDSVLLVLSDWSGSILLAEDEINAERGVIEEEWRSRNNAQIRMYEAILPIIYQEYQYQQMPIGKMEVVRNFKPQVLRDYYHKWYRPDQQGIVVVGDFDAAAMEEKVKALFSKIPMPENAAERVYPQVSDNDKPIYAYYADKEMPYSMVMVSFKKEQIPTDIRNTIEAYMQENVANAMIAKMINNRLDEYKNNPDCHYSYANVSFGDFWVSKTKATFDITVIPKDKISDAYQDALSIVARACKTGFMPSEAVRARDEILSNYEKLYNERNKTVNDNLARKIIRTFIDNVPYPGADKEFQMLKQIMPMIPVEALNEEASTLLTPNNQVIVVSQPEREGMEMVSEEVMTGNLKKILDAEYEAYVDEELPSTLIPQLPAAGKITETKQGAFETTEFTLSNGAKVVVKPTDFKADEILVNIFKKGGRNTYSNKQSNEVNMATDAVDASKLGEYKQSTISKYLAGKKVKMSYEINNVTTSVSGSTTVKDLPTFMELLYLTFTDIRPDSAAYQATVDQYVGVLKEQETTPQFIFQYKLGMANANNLALYNQIPSVAMIQAADYASTLDIVRKSLANAADYTFIFTGNIDVETLKPMLEQYIASLPSTGKAVEPVVVTPVPVIKGIVNETFDQPMSTPSTQVFVTIDDNNIPYNIENDVKISLMGDILGNIFTETLREEEGGTYSPYAFGRFNPWTGYWSCNYLFQTNREAQGRLIERANKELEQLMNQGAKEADFNKAQQAMAKQYEINVRTNKYWNNNLLKYYLGVDDITNHKSAIDNVTLSDFNAFMKNLYNGKNRLNFIMTGVPDGK